MTIQQIDRGTAGNPNDRFKIGAALDTAQANDEYLDSVKPTVIENFAALASTPMTVGQVVTTAGHTVAGIGSLSFIGKAGSVANNGGTQINSATSGVYADAMLDGFVTPQMFGALADGSTDDTASFQDALGSGFPVVVPPTDDYYSISSPLSISTSGQAIYGFGLKSKIIQSGSNTNSSVIKSIGFGNLQIKSIHCAPGTTVTALADGFGIGIFNANNCLIEGCIVSGSRHGGVILQNSSGNIVKGNFFVDSVVEAGDIASQAGADIYLSDTSNNNIISDNYINGSCGIGIGLQTLSDPSDSVSNNIIKGNHIENCGMYGIMLYVLNTSSAVNKTIVSGNFIKNVTGNVLQDDLQGIYGSGIYVQSADDFVITGNIITSTCTDTLVDTNAPAAISTGPGVTGVIQGNIIDDAQKWGITSVQAISFAAAGRGLIIDSNQVQSVNAGVYCLDVVSAQITNNRLRAITSGSAQGIRIRQNALTQSDDYIIKNNRIYNFGVGIEQDGTISESHVVGNIIRGNTGYGIIVRSAYIDCSNNRVVNGTGGDGISIQSTCTDGYCSKNAVVGGDYGILDDNGGTVRTEDNQLTSNATKFSSGVYRPLANSATPSAKNWRWVSNSNTTTITDLTNGFVGQVITLKALANFTVNHGSGILLSGAANFAMTNNDTLTLLREDSSWIELSRVVI